MRLPYLTQEVSVLESAYWSSQILWHTCHAEKSVGLCSLVPVSGVLFNSQMAAHMMTILHVLSTWLQVQPEIANDESVATVQE